MQTSLIITTYNRPDALSLVIKSVLSQSKLPDEIIIADDGSTEATRELIQKATLNSKIPIHHCWQEDLGFRVAAARNKAIAKSQYEYLILIDGDILLHRHHIKMHHRFAAKKRLLQGPRAMLNYERTTQALRDSIIKHSYYNKGLTNRLNAVHFPLLTPLFSFETSDLTRIRSCNISCWREDVLAINGFNEDFIGWGREDTEFMVRMLNRGIYFYKMRLAGHGFHLHHPISSRHFEQRNEEILQETIRTRSGWCLNGIDKYLN